MTNALYLISEEETEEAVTQLYSFEEYEIETTDTATYGREFFQADTLTGLYNKIMTFDKIKEV